MDENEPLEFDCEPLLDRSYDPCGDELGVLALPGMDDGCWDEGEPGWLGVVDCANATPAEPSVAAAAIRNFRFMITPRVEVTGR